MIRFPLVCDKRKCVVKLSIRGREFPTPFREDDGSPTVFACSHDAGLAVANAMHSIHLAAMGDALDPGVVPSITDFSIHHVDTESDDPPVEDVSVAAGLLTQLIEKGKQ